MKENTQKKIFIPDEKIPHNPITIRMHPFQWTRKNQLPPSWTKNASSPATWTKNKSKCVTQDPQLRTDPFVQSVQMITHKKSHQHEIFFPLVIPDTIIHNPFFLFFLPIIHKRQHLLQTPVINSSLPPVANDLQQKSSNFRHCLIISYTEFLIIFFFF